MKFKVAMLAIALLLVTGCGQGNQATQGVSFRAQLCELVQLRDAGAISEREYRSSKRHILTVMLH